MERHSEIERLELRSRTGGLHLNDVFERVFETAPTAIVVVGLDGRFERCNPAFCALVGHDAEAVRSFRFQDMVQVDDHARHRSAIEDLVEGRVLATEVEYRFRQASGDDIWVNAKLSLMPSKGDQPACIVALLSDISDRVQTLTDLHVMREQLEGFIKEAPIPMAMVDRDMRYIRCSRRWISDYGLNLGSIEGRSHYDAFPHLPESWVQAHKRGLAGETVKNAEDWYRWPDGRMQWLRWEVHPWHNRAGEVAGLILFAEDITDRKLAEQSLRESEARLRQAAEAAHFGTFDVDITTGEAHWSPEALSLLGLAPDACPTNIHEMEQLIGHRATLEIGRQLQSAFHPQSDGVLRQDLSITHADGSRRWLQVHGQVMFDSNAFQRSATRVRGMLLDITETRRMQQNLEQAKRLETIGRLSGGIAHDFNNLLTIILSNLELAQRRIDDEDALRLINAAIDALHTGASFNSRLLSLAKTRHTQSGLLDVGHQLSLMWPMLSRAVGDKAKLTLQTIDQPWIVRADDAELTSAVLNLVINACDAMPDGGEIIVGIENVALDAAMVESLNCAAPGDYLRVFVRDTGTGMLPSTAEMAQEPFFTTKTGGRGTGLGLTTVAAFAARENGCVHIETQEGTGTTVSIYLPREQGAETSMLGSDGCEDELAHGDGETVLVVEDDDMVRETVLKRLEVLGYVVFEARNASEAFQQLEAGHHIDLVFSDMSMPGPMSGHDLLAQVRARYPSIGILLTTGNNGPDQNTRSPLGDRNIPLLPKPYSISKLSQCIRDALCQRPRPEI